MPLAVVGVNHQTAPIEVRERFAFGRAEVPPALIGLIDGTAASEAVLLSTCNRTELYLLLPEDRAGIEAARALLASQAGLAPAAAGASLYVHRDRAAVTHLFRVTAGLDSMILGEPQIQGQVRDAYLAAAATSAAAGPVVGPALNRLFQQALSVGGQVRSGTAVGIGAASVPSAAVELTKKIFGSLQGRRAMVIGAGEMGELTIECLRSEGVRATIVANRTHDRACELAERWQGDAVHFSGISAALPRVDIVICSTAAPHPVLSLERFREALPAGARHPLCIIDIALPRDVDPRVGDEPNVFLYNVDDFRQMVDDTLGRRRAELPGAEAIIASATDQFWAWYSALAVVPTIRDLRSRGEALRNDEMQRLLRRLSHLPPEDQAAIDALTKSLLNKLLHSPTVRLRQAAGNGRGTGVLDTVRYLFDLDAAAGHSEPEEDLPCGESVASQPDPGAAVSAADEGARDPSS